MERKEAVGRLRELIGCELHELAKQYEVVVFANDGKVNKGWAGHVFERHLGLPLNSAQSPNFGSWELKSVPLCRLASGILSFKETMAITMIDQYNVAITPFVDSHLLSKLNKLVIVARIVGQHQSDPTYVYSINQVDLSEDLYADIKQDYDEIRDCIWIFLREAPPPPPCKKSEITRQFWANTSADATHSSLLKKTTMPWRRRQS